MIMNKKTGKLTVMAMLCALAFVAVVAIRIPLIPVAPFLEYEPKDIIIMTGGFLFGPMSSVAISVIVSLIEMFTISSTGIIGLIMNILSTIAFVYPAAWLYKKYHSMKGALVGMILGSILMTLVMVLWNYLITPIYMGYPRDAVVKLLLPAIVPFNLLKSGINTALTLLIYKPLSNALKRTNLLAFQSENKSLTGKFNLEIALILGIILITVIFVILVLKGIM
nr:ECF transporter S component [Clostridium sp. HBUAS56010]